MWENPALKLHPRQPAILVLQHAPQLLLCPIVLLLHSRLEELEREEVVALLFRLRPYQRMASLPVRFPTRFNNKPMQFVFLLQSPLRHVKWEIPINHGVKRNAVIDSIILFKLGFKKLKELIIQYNYLTILLRSVS